MRCSDAERLIQREVVGQLSGFRRMALLWHCRGCIECSSDLDFHRALQSDLDQWRRVPSKAKQRRARMRRARLAIVAAVTIGAVVLVTSPHPANANLRRMETALSGVRTAHILVFDQAPTTRDVRPRLEMWYSEGRVTTIDHAKPLEVDAPPENGEKRIIPLEGEPPTLFGSMMMVLGAPTPMPGSVEAWQLPVPRPIFGLTSAEAGDFVVLKVDEKIENLPPAGAIEFETDPKTGLPLRARILRREGGKEPVGWVRFQFDGPVPADVFKKVPTK